MFRRRAFASLVAGAALALASTGPALAQEMHEPDRYEADSKGLTTPNMADNIIEVGPASGGFGGGGIGHASSTSFNTHGDIAEGLSNQWINDDDD